jgi:outer membrane protein assembly factor BamE (lipoprotein component of BamABCDE complex)
MWKSMKRWPVLLAVLVVLAALAVGLVCLPYRSRVTRENCERIKEGMTEAEVRAILGKPWDDSLLDPDPPSHSDVEEARSLWT